MRSPEQITALYHSRQKSRDPVVRRMEDVRSRYQDEIVVALPRMDEAEKVYTANLLQKGLDAYGQRIGSTPPNLYAPPTNARNQTSRDKADIRRRATLGWWEANRMTIKIRRRARWLVGYGVAPVVIRPWWERGIARWDPRDPLGCYPAPTLDPDDMCPPDVIFAVKRSLGVIW